MSITLRSSQFLTKMQVIVTNGSWLGKLVALQGIPSEEDAPYFGSVPNA